ncbi:MAG: phosphatase PAP2 family protein [Firmicutes bacterium]|nr:phosphatase PAP2 family protein [Bacillota bacterium]
MNFLIIFCAKYLLFVSVVIAGASFLFAGKAIKMRTIWLGATASLIALIITEISARFIYDARPFVVKNIQPLIQHPADNGFPSDHTLAAALIAFIVFTYNKKMGSILVILAFLTGASRVLALVHHPLDIIGSFLIALSSTLVSYYALKVSAGRKTEV